MSFDKWDSSVHNNFEQLKRRISATKIDEDDIELDPANQTARIYGSDPEPYLVTLEECSCYSFRLFKAFLLFLFHFRHSFFITFC